MAIGLLLLAGGYLVGLWSPWSAHHTRTVTGIVSVDGYDPGSPPTTTWPGAHLTFDDERILFRLDDLVWRDGRSGGEGTIPPCLRSAGVRVEVESEVIKLGGTFGSDPSWHVVALTCPPG